MAPKQAIERYLEKYAEFESSLEFLTQLPSLTEVPYEHSLVIPAYDETATQIERVYRHLDPSSFLAIIVINAPVAGDTNAVSLHAELSGSSGRQSSAAQHLRRTELPDLLIIDRYSDGRTINPRQGVGLARKIGADIALRLYHLGAVKSPWLSTTDADAILPCDYFERKTAPADVAEILPFIHNGDAELQLATLLYEIHMLYYVAGLRWAGSPYAYTTVGSTLRLLGQTYAQVRGFPKRPAGEDFHLLSKLRKLGPVAMCHREPIRLEARLSERVPVGTGPALKAISSLSDPMNEYNYYHPNCFLALKDFLGHLSRLSESHNSTETDNPIIASYIDYVGLMERYEKKVRERPSTAVMSKYLADWFDGLKTLQFVHYMRDNHFGSLPLSEFTGNPIIESTPVTDVSSLQTIRDRLAARVFC